MNSINLTRGRAIEVASGKRITPGEYCELMGEIRELAHHLEGSDDWILDRIDKILIRYGGLEIGHNN